MTGAQLPPRQLNEAQDDIIKVIQTANYFNFIIFF